MRAIVTSQYGPPEVLELQEVETPVPGEREVLVRVHATTVSSGDCRARSCDLSGVPIPARVVARSLLGWKKPRKSIQGLWLAGEVVATGKKAKRFREGERVVARTPDLRFGAYGEYAALPENGFILAKPDSISFEEAVALPFGGLTALYFLRKGKLRSGHRLLVYGASGAVGSSAVQLARCFGANVTGVCSGANREMVTSLGADRVVDYTKENFFETGDRYDLIFDAVGKMAYKTCSASLSPGGAYLSVITSGHAKMRTEELHFLFELARSKQLKPVIDRVYPLEQIVEAHRYVDQGHKKGNVVIAV